MWWVGGLLLLGAPLAVWYLGVWGVLLVLPVFAWFAGRFLVHGGFASASWLRRRQLEPWNGRYYAFATVQLRAAEIEGRLVFVEEDLLTIIEQPQSTAVTLFGSTERVTLPDSGRKALTQEGCERLLLKCPHRDAKKLLLFLRREAFGPFAKRAAMAQA